MFQGKHWPENLLNVSAVYLYIIRQRCRNPSTGVPTMTTAAAARQQRFRRKAVEQGWVQCNVWIDAAPPATTFWVRLLCAKHT
jgi:hypothetical protein